MRLNRALLQLGVVSAALAVFDPAVDSPCESEGICLSSFIWCSYDSEPSCFFPEGVDPLAPASSIPYAVLYHGNQYDITWRQAVPDLPVLVQWYSSLETFPFDAEDTGETRLIWSANATKDLFTFDPETILESFPTADAPNLSRYEAAMGTVGIGNFIYVSQPGSGYPEARSQQFTMQMRWSDAMAQNMKEDFRQREAQREKQWTLGVGIGVGLGVPLLMGLTWMIASRRAPGPSTKAIEDK